MDDPLEVLVVVAAWLVEGKRRTWWSRWRGGRDGLGRGDGAQMSWRYNALPPYNNNRVEDELEDTGTTLVIKLIEFRLRCQEI
jgi:hypothetical protein